MGFKCYGFCARVFLQKLWFPSTVMHKHVGFGEVEGLNQHESKFERSGQTV